MAKSVKEEPVRLQDIPQEVLKLYGIVLVEENLNLTEIVTKDVTKDVSKETAKDDDKDDDITECEDEENEPVLVIDESQEISADVCKFCHHTITEESIMKHNLKHCPYHNKCLDLVVSDWEKNTHKVMHSYPSKPFQCFICRKRYKTYTFAKKHREVCKVRNWRLYMSKMKKIENAI